MDGLMTDPIGESSRSHPQQLEPTGGDDPSIDGHEATGQAGETMSDWMRSEDVDYITACGHERHRMGKQAALPASRVGERGEWR